jgi:hypothetical protein
MKEHVLAIGISSTIAALITFAGIQVRDVRSLHEQSVRQSAELRAANVRIEVLSRELGACQGEALELRRQTRSQAPINPVQPVVSTVLDDAL